MLKGIDPSSEVNRLLVIILVCLIILIGTKYSGLDGFRRGLAATCSWFCNPDNLRHYKPDNYVV